MSRPNSKCLESIQLLSVYFLNIRVSQLTKRIQDLQRDGDIRHVTLATDAAGQALLQSVYQSN